MNLTPNTTEFSTHLSRSRMRRYLHEQLGKEETRQVEVHLAHCAQCSATLVNYIESEEPDQYNTYAKRLHGKLKEQKIAKRTLLSSFQVRALRATAAVVALLIFSFFGVKTIINKEVDNYQADGKTVQVQKKAAPVSQKKSLKNKNTEKVIEEKIDKRLAENHQPKSTTSKHSAVTKTSKTKEAPTKKVAAKVAPTTTKPVVKPETQPAKQEVAKKEEPKTPTTVVPEATEQEEIIREKPAPLKKVATLEKSEDGDTEESATQEASAPIKTLPAIKKMDANKSVDAAQSGGSSSLPVVPIPSNELR